MFKLHSNLKKIFLTFIVMFFLCAIMLFFVELLPNGIQREHIIESIPQFDKQGDYPTNFVVDNMYTQLDNWTDSSVLTSIYLSDSVHPYKSAFAQDGYDGEGFEGAARLISLINDGIDEECITTRAQYWMGVRVFLQPYLLIGTFQSFKMLIQIIAFFMLFVVIIMLSRRLNNTVALTFGLSVMLCGFQTVSVMMINVLPFCIAFAGMMYILRNDKEYDRLALFLALGCLTAFFDWFTTPILTFALPIITDLLLSSKRENKSTVQYFNITFNAAIGWCIGYFVMLVGKAVLSTGVLGIQGILNFYARARNDSVGGSFNAGIIDNIARAYTLCINGVFPNVYFANVKEHLGIIIFWIIFIISCIVSVLYRKERNVYLIIVLCSFSGLLWILVFNHFHSIHGFYAYRTMVAVVWPVLLVISNFIEIKKNSTDKR